MSKLAHNLFVAIALLLSQTTLALHEIHCLDEGHTETCQVCATHDQNACAPANLNKLESPNYKERLSLVSIENSLEGRTSFYLSRAPPHNL